MVPQEAKRRAVFSHVANNVLFPVRALFMGPKGYFGLEALRDERMRIVSEYCRGRVLDVGCGPGNHFIRKHVGCDHGLGIDFFPYEGVTNLVDDPTNLPFVDGSFDTITLIAVGGHIPRSKRAAEFSEFARVLRPGGRLIMTEGEPITQYLVHAWWHFYLGLQGKTDVDHERQMADDEELCMPRKELMRFLNTPPFRLILHRRFMWRLNNVFVAERA
jgi:SAM-dependent methyltransferase